MISCNLLIQSYFTTSFLLELKNLDFLNSDYYKSVEFEDKFVQEHLPSVGIDNQGAMLMVLYAMLVVPKQLIQTDFPEEFENLNQVVEELKLYSRSTYRQDSERIDYVRHIRNAVAHARVLFNPNIKVTFTDENNRGERCVITIQLADFGRFLTELQKVFFKYIEKFKT
jgi:hypothetical protein